MYRNIFKILIILLLLTFAWDYGDTSNINGFRLYQWNINDNTINKIYNNIQKDIREYQININDENKFKFYWTLRAYDNAQESEDSNKVGIKPDIPTGIDVGL